MVQQTARRWRRNAEEALGFAFGYEELHTTPDDGILSRYPWQIDVCENNAYAEGSRSASFVPSLIGELGEHNCEADLSQSSFPALLSDRV